VKASALVHNKMVKTLNHKRLSI